MHRANATRYAAAACAPRRALASPRAPEHARAAQATRGEATAAAPHSAAGSAAGGAAGRRRAVGPPRWARESNHVALPLQRRDAVSWWGAATALRRHRPDSDTTPAEGGAGVPGAHRGAGARRVIRGDLARGAPGALFTQCAHNARVRRLPLTNNAPPPLQAVCVAAQRCGSPFVAQRWIGGTLTNFASLQRTITALDAVGSTHAPSSAEGAATAEPPHSRATKKAALVAAHAAARAERRVGTLRGMSRLPGAMFVVDAAREAGPLAEAARAGVTTVAVCDSDTAHPEAVDYPIPANAHSPACVRLLCELAARAVLHGRGAETPEQAWTRHVVATRRAEDASGGSAGSALVAAGGDANQQEDGSFYGPWGYAPLCSRLSGLGRQRGRTRHAGGGKRPRQTR